MRKRMFTKRIVKRISFMIASGLSIELNSYALIRPTVPGRPESLFSKYFLVFKASAYSYNMLDNHLFGFFRFVGVTTWLDSVTNRPLKVNQLFTLCLLMTFVHTYGCIVFCNKRQLRLFKFRLFTEKLH